MKYTEEEILDSILEEGKIKQANDRARYKAIAKQEGEK